MTDVLTMTDQEILAAKYVPLAVYYTDSDCVEYVKQDSFCVYERVDDFLTLIFDDTKMNLVGFKLKGFRCIFEMHLKPLFKLHDMQFVDLVSVLELHFTQIGNKVFESGDDRKIRAYKAAIRLAANDNVQLKGASLKDAALKQAA